MSELRQPKPKRNDPRSIKAWADFKVNVETQGGKVLETEWLGKDNPHKVICSKGHECFPAPGSVRMGIGICRACAGKDPKEAYNNFIKVLSSFGATCLETSWLGNHTPHRIKCAQGHICSPQPTNVLGGTNPCRVCARKGDWQTFYVFESADGTSVKFGVTKRDYRRRLCDHKAIGFTKVLRLIENCSDALQLERNIIRTLAAAGERPIKGREYFNIEALGLVLDIVDNSVRVGV